MTRQVEHAVHVRLDDGTAVVTIGRGQRRNALAAGDWHELACQVESLSGQSSLRAVLVRGAGSTFCAGSDVAGWVGATPEAVEDSFAHMERAFRAIEACPVPVIAEIRGVAAGAGCQLALACDLRVMAESARIGMPIARLGILPSPAFAARLVRACGSACAAELLYTGRLLRARDALVAGLATACVPDDCLTDRVSELLIDTIRHPPAAVRAAKRAITEATSPVPRHNLGPAVAYEEFQHGIAHFLSRT